MGLKDRLTAAKRHLWSPMKVWMAGKGSDEVVRAGESARVVVEVTGEDDGTATKIVVGLKLTGRGLDGASEWILAELPAQLGRHELDVEIPGGLPPASAGYTEYVFTCELLRTKGMNDSAMSIVDVVGRVEDLYWPASRTGGSGLTIELDEEIVVAGGAPVTGRVVGVGAGDVEVEVGTLIDTLVTVAGQSQPQQREQFKAVEKVTVAAGEPFSVAIPEGMPPSLRSGKTTIAWQVRATSGGAEGWRVVGVIDPEAKAGARNPPSPSLASFLSDFV